MLLSSRNCAKALILSVLIAAVLTAGCGRPNMDDAVSVRGVKVGMGISDAEKTLGEPLQTETAYTFVWRRYKEGITVGYARSSSDAPCQVAWLSATQGKVNSLIQIGDSVSQLAERLKLESQQGSTAFHRLTGKDAVLDLYSEAGAVTSVTLHSSRVWGQGRGVTWPTQALAGLAVGTRTGELITQLGDPVSVSAIADWRVWRYPVQGLTVVTRALDSSGDPRVVWIAQRIGSYMNMISIGDDETRISEAFGTGQSGAPLTIVQDGVSFTVLTDGGRVQGFQVAHEAAMQGYPGLPERACPPQVSRFSLGGIRLWATEAEIRSAIGQPDTATLDKQGITKQMVFERSGFTVYLEQPPGGQWQVFRIMQTRGRYSELIAIGARQDDLEAYFGPPQLLTDVSPSDIGWAFEDENGDLFEVVVDNGVVSSLVLSLEGGKD